MGRECSLLAVDGKHLARPFTICFLHYYAIYGSSLLTVLGKWLRPGRFTSADMLISLALMVTSCSHTERVEHIIP